MADECWASCGGFKSIFSEESMGREKNVGCGGGQIPSGNTNTNGQREGQASTERSGDSSGPCTGVSSSPIGDAHAAYEEATRIP
jgi:hypothetical protein